LIEGRLVIKKDRETFLLGRLDGELETWDFEKFGSVSEVEVALGFELRIC